MAAVGPVVLSCVLRAEGGKEDLLGLLSPLPGSISLWIGFTDSAEERQIKATAPF
jgi:hypothetical protein